MCCPADLVATVDSSQKQFHFEGNELGFCGTLCSFGEVAED